MRYFVFFTISSLLVLALSSSTNGAAVGSPDGERQARIYSPEYPTIHGYQQGQECPAPTFKDDCNICVCGKDGHSAACTKMYCHPQNQS